MRRRQTHKPKTERHLPETAHTGLPSILAAAAFSFLKETRGLTTWTARDMARTFSITEAEAKQVIAVLELQGYVKPSGANEWMTTLSGEEASGSRQPRYRHETIGQALSWLGKRMAEANRDSGATNANRRERWTWTEMAAPQALDSLFRTTLELAKGAETDGHSVNSGA